MAAIESELKLQDRTAIITGAMTSYNQAIAMKFTQLGGNVALLDRNNEKAQRFADSLMDAREINERFGRATAVNADLSKPHHVQDAITRAAEAFGGVDIYIDGLMVSEVKKFKDASSIEDLDRALDTNLKAPLLMTHAVMRFLEGRKRGRIIYLIHDLLRLGFEQNSLLTASRTGLINFSKTLAREAAENHVTVNCVALGLTEDFLLNQFAKEKLSIQQGLQQIQKTFPMAAMADMEKTASLIAFLASPLGAGITGQTIAASQGLSLF